MADDWWDRRYAGGGSSGPGSEGELGRWKVEQLALLVHALGPATILDMGCGDGVMARGVLGHFPAGASPEYVGWDTSVEARRLTRSRGLEVVDEHPREGAEMVWSLDVLYHLVDEMEYEMYLASLFGLAERWVVVYNPGVYAGPSNWHVKWRPGWLFDAGCCAGLEWSLGSGPRWNPHQEDPQVGFWLFERGE